MNFNDFLHDFFGLSGVSRGNSLRYFLWYDVNYALDWGYMVLASDPGVAFTHVTSEKCPPKEFPNATYEGCMYDAYATVYKYKGLMKSNGYGVSTPPSQDFWDSHQK